MERTIVTTPENRGGTPPSPDAELRERAIKRIRKQADFRTHLLVYLTVNAFLVVVWAWTDSPVFWPIFPILGWGIGVAIHAWDAYRTDLISEQRIRREMDRLEG
jgi:hypothetical protein